jgi:hypothetical protein
MKTYIIGYDDLDSAPEQVREYLIEERILYKYQYRYALVICEPETGRVIDTYYDGGEPEDQTFVRDWDWVPKVIEVAYKAGYMQGQYDAQNR